MKLSVDTSKTKSVICVILFSLFFIFWHVSGYAETIPKNDSPDILELRQRGSKLYTQFLKFKKEQDFINSGFGNSKSHDKYEQWLKEVDLLIKTSSVITSYSIHYTKLYESRSSSTDWRRWGATCVPCTALPSSPSAPRPPPPSRPGGCAPTSSPPTIGPKGWCITSYNFV